MTQAGKFFCHKICAIFSNRLCPNQGYADPPPSEMVRFLWEMWNVLKWMKNEIQFFCDFYFSSYRENSSKIGVMTSQIWSYRSKNRNLKNLKFDFSFDSADCRYFVNLTTFEKKNYTVYFAFAINGLSKIWNGTPGLPRFVFVATILTYRMSSCFLRWW